MSQNNPLILFMLLPETSAYNASFTLARRLREQGYRILYGGPERFEEHVQAQGFDYERLEVPEPEFIKTPEGQPEPGAIGRWRRTRKVIRYYRRELRALLERSVARFAEIDPALVLFDPLIWPYAELPLRSGVPMISFSTTLAAYFNLQVPPVFSDIPAGDPERWQVRLRNLFAWSRCILKARFNLFMYEKLFPLFYALPPQASGVKRIRQLGGILRWGEYGPRLIVPELVVAPRELDFPQLVASNDRTYIGACVDTARSDGEFDWSDLDRSKPLVYCSLGTYSEWFRNGRGLFVSVIEALRQHENLQAIVQVGNVADIESFGELPERIRLVKKVPQLEVLERADIFITHAGFSSTREACYFGVPVIAFPYCNDGLGNAARLVHHGMGVRGDFTKVTSAMVLDLLKEVQGEQYSAAAKRMQVHFRQQADCLAGLEFIERFLSAECNLGSVERKVWGTHFHQKHSV
ncbi:hypothetical protein DNJ95_07095 [Stutzerimonas kirkiae]|uniref:Erythromycin biosynthesis protein CIII-like C-terminal domain-containing protein n=1 Tax=Stutzerimonas kirkiae TaxID=2211392 RepID=A0A4Q9R6T9_9GAMM|nr:nucleotide disphospho-sugar-binding domain-containing protein [Stutzerimonas kirkiae]TBU96300.1 hypothetical protein DNJ96_11035 [Stutzerimonas kirkiae]TBV03358.1 hypothetical protein DNJ95_07095 [Stutzerimonas kirkiae]TBV12879.1 hypothetical protein DNK01_13195 [Stutzerimonas kirkiae]